MHCSYTGLRIYVLFPDAEESTGLNDEQAVSAQPPIKKLIVCPPRRGNDPLGFNCTSLVHTTQLNSNPTAFDCLRAYRKPQWCARLFSVSVCSDSLISCPFPSTFLWDSQS